MKKQKSVSGGQKIRAQGTRALDGWGNKNLKLKGQSAFNFGLLILDF
jgi:hypothetical protein